MTHDPYPISNDWWPMSDFLDHFIPLRTPSTWSWHWCISYLFWSYKFYQKPLFYIYIYIWKYLLITYLKAWKTPKVLCSRRHDNYVWKEVSDTWIAATVHLSHCIQCIGHFYKQHHWQRLDHIYQMAYLGVYSWFWWPNCITPHLFYILHYCNLNILCHKVLVHHQQWGLLN